MRQVVVMVATSYPRFPGDGVGSFMEPIAKGVAARGHEVHLVAPWHPAITRGKVEDGVHFHFFHYAPLKSPSVFGYATGLREDTRLKASAWAVAPLAVASGTWKAMRVAVKRKATIMHAHWVVPGGVMATLGRRGLPMVVSLHGSDVFIAERVGVAGRAAHAVFQRAAWVTACSDDLTARAISLGARRDRIETVPYGVDTRRFAPDPAARKQIRAQLGIGDEPLVFSAGRLVRKKGFEYLIDAVASLQHDLTNLRLIIAGDGDLRHELAARARAALLPSQIQLVGNQSQDDVARFAAAADIVAVPSVHDEAGNVDGLPNFALEALATATPVVATKVGGLPQAVDDGVTGRLVPERNAQALASTIGELLANPSMARQLGLTARFKVERDFSWARAAER